MPTAIKVPSAKNLCSARNKHKQLGCYSVDSDRILLLSEPEIVRSTERQTISDSEKQKQLLLLVRIEVRVFTPYPQNAGGSAPRAGNVVARMAEATSLLRNAQQTFGDDSVFTGATRHRGNIVIQQNDIDISIENLRLMQGGNALFAPGGSLQKHAAKELDKMRKILEKGGKCW